MHEIFNRNILLIHRDRAANKIHNSDFLFIHSLKNLVDRAHIYKEQYDVVLNMGSRVFDLHKFTKGKIKMGLLVNSDISSKMLNKVSGNRVQLDEEFIPFLDGAFDLVINNLNLHWVNDLPGSLIQTHKILKKGGMFVASFIGENSLHELKSALLETETELNKPVHFHVSPTIASESASALFVRAGFKDVVVDKETIKVEYSNPLKLLEDLQNMGESNCMSSGKIRYFGKDVLKGFVDNYVKMFPGNSDGVTCTFELITCVGHK